MICLPFLMQVSLKFLMIILCNFIQQCYCRSVLHWFKLQSQFCRTHSARKLMQNQNLRARSAFWDFADYFHILFLLFLLGAYSALSILNLTKCRSDSEKSTLISYSTCFSILRTHSALSSYNWNLFCFIHLKLN